MSLVGLKNIFFQKTVTPVPARRKSIPAALTTPVEWTDDENSRQPLLSSASSLTSQSSRSTGETYRPDSDTDLESQSNCSKNEKGCLRKAFRVDARLISDATIGLSDGLTVPFALTAGLSALGNTKVVIYGGFAELIAGAISMGLGGYLGAKSEA